MTRWREEEGVHSGERRMFTQDIKTKDKQRDRKNE
jgi:hypothetical protein